MPSLLSIASISRAIKVCRNDLPWHGFKGGAVVGAASSTTGGAHIVDAAIRPLPRPKPSRPIVLGGAVALGLISCMFFYYAPCMTVLTDPLFCGTSAERAIIGEIYLPAQVAAARDAYEAARKALPCNAGPTPFGGMRLRSPGRAGRGPRSGYVGTRGSRRAFANDPSVEALREVRTRSRATRATRQTTCDFHWTHAVRGEELVASNLGRAACLRSVQCSHELMADMRRWSPRLLLGMIIGASLVRAPQPNSRAQRAAAASVFSRHVVPSMR